MPEIHSHASFWLLVASVGAPMVIGVGWAIVEGFFCRLIPRKEIERLADEVMHCRPGHAERAAFEHEVAAWHRNRIVEQGQWRRVRREFRRRRSKAAPRRCRLSRRP
jgi:hypothetical protein